MSNTKEKKEWKWPLGIFLGYMIFVTATLSFVFFTFTQRTDLVVDNYYEKTLTYQQHINRAQNAMDLEIPFRYEHKDKQVSLIFPENLVSAGIEGEVVFYRPSDSHLDTKLPIYTDEAGHQMISLDKFQPGMWKLQVTWTSGETEYYTESNLYLQ